jgi:hypothetical protein
MNRLPCKWLCRLFALVAFPVTVWSQGSLTPPGAPAPTMKTLSQVEPRTPISSLPFTITNSGSYYLTTNLTGVASANGITVQASRVAIDLRGFTLAGVAGSLNGVTVSPAQSGLAIFGGSVGGWGGVGISASNASGSEFNHLILSQNTSHGLVAGSNCVVRDCVATGNSGDGLDLTASCFAKDNNCQANSLCGIHVLGNTCRVEENHVVANGTSGVQVDGAQNLIIKNSAANNVASNYNIAANNDCGQILASPGLGFTNYNPWANFSTTPAPTCSDGIKNGNETDVDCGGGTCPACATGKQCLVAADCVSGNCSGGVCVSLLANGSPCTSGAQCSSSFCVTGVCCNSACPGSGICGPNCSTGTCTYTSAGTTCAAASCSGSTLTRASNCDGAGNCVNNGTQNCAPYICSGAACLTSCSGNSPSGDTQCVSSSYCNSTFNCVFKLSSGGACTRNGQCISGNCSGGNCL